MLRVGLTGGLGSGKTTVATMLAAKGAYVLSADELGHRLMQPGQAVYVAIVARFGTGVVLPVGELDRKALARIAFSEGRVEELNAIVHPAVIALQGELVTNILRNDPAALVVIESALIFETNFGEGWRQRFDRIVLVIAPEESKIARFVARSETGKRAELEAEARRRLTRMIPDEDKLAKVDFVVRNEGTITELQNQVDRLWEALLGQLPHA